MCWKSYIKMRHTCYTFTICFMFSLGSFEHNDAKWKWVQKGFIAVLWNAASESKLDDTVILVMIHPISSSMMIFWHRNKQFLPLEQSRLHLYNWNVQKLLITSIHLILTMAIRQRLARCQLVASLFIRKESIPGFIWHWGLHTPVWKTKEGH